MKCSSCNRVSSFAVQCTACGKQFDLNCAKISQSKWKDLVSKQAVWKCSLCQTPSPPQSPVPGTLDTVLKEIQELKSQVSSLHCIIADVQTIKQKLSCEIAKSFIDLKHKVSNLENKVTQTAHATLERKINALQNDIAMFKSRVAGSMQKPVNNMKGRGVPTRDVEVLFSPRNSVCKQRRPNKPSRIAYGMAWNMFKHAFLILRTYLDWFIDLVFAAYWEPAKKELPPLEKRHEMLKLSAVQLADKIRKREITSEELVRATIERIKAVNPILNAVTDERFEAALEEAKEIDKKIAEGLPDDYFKDKPFLGVPFTAKESHAVCGLLHTLGVSSRRHARAAEDAECVRLLRRAGALPVAVTNVPEINKWQETRNLVFGQTNNPFHTGRTTGGSSGGEAALQAAAAVPISLCSDIGGSTRMPAFYCGLFGHNPTGNQTSLKGSALRSGEDDTMASIGFVSRHCSDLAPLTHIVAGDSGPALDLTRPVDVKKVRFYYVETARDLRVSPVCKDLRDAMAKVVSHLSDRAPSTAVVPQPYYHPGFDYMYSLWRHCMAKEGENFAALLTNNQGEANGLLELARKVVGQSQYSGAAIMKLLDDQVLPAVPAAWADSLIKDLKEDLLSKLGSDGVLLFPSAPAPAPYHYSAFLRPFNFAYWCIFNVLRLPATQVPLGLSPSGLPLGIQVAAGPRQDSLCLAVGQHLEDTFGGYVPPFKDCC